MLVSGFISLKKILFFFVKNRSDNVLTYFSFFLIRLLITFFFCTVMSQYKSKANGKVTQVILELRGKLNFVVVKLDDGVQFDFPVPTIQEIRDRFFFKRAKTQPDKPARPPNKFFIFRTIFQSAIYNLKLQ